MLPPKQPVVNSVLAACDALHLTEVARVRFAALQVSSSRHVTSTLLASCFGRCSQASYSASHCHWAPALLQMCCRGTRAPSVSCVLLFAGQRPWGGLMQMQIIFHVTIQKKRLQYPDATPAEFKVQGSGCDPVIVMCSLMHPLVSWLHSEPGLCTGFSTG